MAATTTLLLLLSTACTSSSERPDDTSAQPDTSPGAVEPTESTPTTEPSVTTPVTEPGTPPTPGELLAADPYAEEDAPVPRRAWRMVYGMEGITGPVPATAMVVTPAGTPPAGGWPAVVWAHPTRGTADPCAPSSVGPASIPLLDQLLAEGWAVVAPDYEGLGAPGPHPYLVGSSGGRSLLDALRAAPAIPGAGLEVGGPAVLWGFSQGGHATLFAAQLAADTDDPTLDGLRAVAVAAPVSDVEALTVRSEDWPEQFGVLATVVGAYATTFDELDPSDILTEAGVALLPTLEDRCIGDVLEAYDQPPDELLRLAPRHATDWAARLAENQAGRAPTRLPTLVVQGDADTIVDPSSTASLVGRLCTGGDEVSSMVLAGEHGVDTSGIVIPWIRERLAGTPMTSNCTTGR